MRGMILIVDDDYAIREILQEELESEGYTVVTSASGQNALSFIKTQKFDYIFSDLKMRNGDGLFLLRETRKLFPHIPFYIMSGFVDDAAKELWSLGVSGLLNKPYNLSDLYRILNRPDVLLAIA